MSVAVGGGAVGGPAGVADAGAAGGGLVAEEADQVVDAAGPLAQVQPGAGQASTVGVDLGDGMTDTGDNLLPVYARNIAHH